MLNGCRALDLTDQNGFLCGKILADLGVDVIKIEPPGGDPARKAGPFWSDIPDPEKSLYWFAYNSNKRGITLNINTKDGKEILYKLIKSADFIIESFPPGYMEDMELGYSALDSIKKGIILVSITPFGQSGPYKDFQTTDIVTMGMAGILYQTGDFDRPPVHMNVPQACLHASADGAVGALLAYYHREMTGEGQHIDAAMQQSTAWFLANAVPFWELSNVVMKRAGSFRWANKSYQRQVWECKDGYVFFFMLGGKQGARTFHELVNWMDSEGMANDYLRSMDWETLDVFNASQEMIDKISDPIQAFFMSHTKQEISQGAGERQISMCPLSSMEDLLHSEQLQARNFWTEIEHPELNTTITYPREFVKSSETSYETRFRAPLIGEHNEEVYKEIGLSKQELVVLKQAGII